MLRMYVSYSSESPNPLYWCRRWEVIADLDLLANEYACKDSDCSVSDQVKIGQCKPFESGIWAKFECMGGCE